MNILCRVDASLEIGAGHLMRCLALANALNKRGAQCTFLSYKQKGDLHALVDEQGHKRCVISSDEQAAPAIASDKSYSDKLIVASQMSEEREAQRCIQLLGKQRFDLLIVDHYHLAKTFCRSMRAICKRILVIDDLANREHDCDILLDQNLLPNASTRYQNLIPNACQTLLGPQYALLREEFYQSKTIDSLQQEEGHLLVNFGGNDIHNLSALCIEAMANSKYVKSADIVIGANHPSLQQLKSAISLYPGFTLHIQTKEMARLMHKASLMIGAGGSSHWERCICSLPALIVTVAENQVETTRYLDSLGVCQYVADASDGINNSISATMLASCIDKFLSSPDLLESMRKKASEIVPKQAGTPLVCDTVLTLL
uniref:UDP-2,4-diacetamido-2,4, 6-trideoxy-beta-L-altropyranose hydrolase n=1 Tax=Ningiella ruwaisensis TaxID=2364274 RepID=UPI0014488599|nr:UDP-2,4-diacetamido-2,4,6-trideoxy-beta-L-altropyranose hydrolase [Ningiella ruwaisensis]